MTKTTKEIITILVFEALIYLLLLVGFPMLKDYVYSWATCTDLFDRQVPWVIYTIPAIIGVWFILMVVILNKGAKGNE